MLEFATNLLNRAWLNHVYEEDAFPREMFLFDHKKNRKRFVVNNVEEYLAVCKNMFGKRSIYTSVNSLTAQKNKTYHKLYIDIDAHTDGTTLDEVYAEAQKIEELFPYCVMYFSGNGFAIYVPFPPTVLQHYDVTVRRYIEKLSVENRLKYVDWHVVGVISEVSRVVLTINMKEKCGKMCVPVRSGQTLIEILANSQHTDEVFMPFNNQLVECNQEVAKDLMFIDERLKEEDLKKNSEFVGEVSSEKIKGYLNDIETILLMSPNINDGRHTLLFAKIVPALILKQISLKYENDEEIHKICREFIERTGKEYIGDYERYVKCVIGQDRKKPFNPWSWEKVFTHRPDLVSCFSNI